MIQLERAYVMEIAKDLRREQAMRKNVYPRMVASGKLEQATADRRELILSHLIGFLDTMEEMSRQTGGKVTVEITG